VQQLDRLHRARYDAAAPTYDRTRFGDRRGDLARRVKNAAVLRLLRRSGLLEPGRRILDAATGTGRICRELAATPADIVGIDISRAMLAECRATTHGRVGLLQADLKALGFPAETFDAVTLGSFLYLVPAAAYGAFTADLRRVLKPGGRLVCEVANSFTLFNPRNLWRIARWRRQRAVKSYVPPWRLEGLVPGFTCESVTGVEYPVWIGDRLARVFGRTPGVRAAGGKYIAVLRRR